MPCVRLAVTLPSSMSLGRVTRAPPDAGISIRTALADVLETAGLEFDVTSVSPSVESPRRRRVLTSTVRGGYFETLCGCSPGALAAAAVGVAKPTCSETRRRAEAAVLSRYLDDGTMPGETA